MILLGFLPIILFLKSIHSDIVELKMPEEKQNIDNASAVTDNNVTTPCDRFLRSTELEVRNPRNHKFITSNGWDRHRPRPEINVYPRAEETVLPAVTSYYQHQQHNENYYNSRQQQAPIRTSKRIIYYATLPDIVRPNYPPPPYPAEPYISPYSAADFRHLDSNRPNTDGQRTRLLPYENSYNNRGQTTVTTSSYNSRYDEPAEFRDSFFRPNEFSSKFTTWPESLKRISSWDKEPFYRVPTWDKEPFNQNTAWDKETLNRGSGWERDLVEIPLQKPYNSDNNKYPDVAVVQSDVIDVRGNRQNTPSERSPSPRFTIIDVDPRPYYQQPPPLQHEKNPLQSMQYEPQQPPSMRYNPQQPPSSRYGQPPQPQLPQNKPFTTYYENIKNNIKTHKFATSWTDNEMPKPDVTVSTHSVSIDISSLGNNTSVLNNTRITPFTNTTRITNQV
ncbi:uncharacterized protein LOC126838972 isoform X2 [Adelges cooleyi]|nr:uncharacterized protein LOC126838972 isoform X2 [Adelges cooleyi]XP_050429767.1 uncharacterized protein LOC126838972 isoform X2 [Adelges cooleyi]